MSKAGVWRAKAQGALSRREFGQLVGAAAVGLLVDGGKVFAHAQNAAKSAADDLTFRSATELARMIREKKISSRELCEAHLRRITAVHPRLNAVFQVDRERILRDAKAADDALSQSRTFGPLHGVPVTIKDSFDTAGIITTAGTQGRAKHVPDIDATVVKRLRQAGAIIFGKSNTPELTLSYETDNLVYGRTNNPYDLARTPGGSSGGAAAAIAAGCSPLDVGSDTAGSLRVPAHFCGIASLKPTWGRVSRAGHIIPPGGAIGRCTHAGPLARYVEDLILLLPILSGADSRDPDAIPAVVENPNGVNLKGMRIASYTARKNAATTPDIAATIRNAVKALTETGASAQDAAPPDFTDARSILGVINAGDSGDYFRRILRQCGTTTPGPAMTAFLEGSRAGGVSGRKYSDALLYWARFREAALEFMSDYDLIICPVGSNTAPLHGGVADMNFSDSNYFNLLGWPAAVVRAGRDKKGLPIGVQVVGRPWFDHYVLAAAQHIEKELGGYKRDFVEAALVVA